MPPHPSTAPDGPLARARRRQGLGEYALTSGELGAVSAQTVMVALLPVLLSRYSPSALWIGFAVGGEGIFALLVSFLNQAMKPAQCCSEGDSVQDCARMMKEDNVGFVPVCNDAGEPVGAITDRDLSIRVLAAGRSADTKVDAVMTRDVVSCRIGDDLETAERAMREHRKARVMVCDEGGKLVGVISLSDIADLETDENAAQTFRDVASRESQQPHAS